MRLRDLAKTSDAKLINLFLDMLAAEQGAGANTLDAYRRDLDRFLGISRPRSGQGFAGVETQALRDYLADLDARGFKSSSVARRLSAMRHLFRFLLNERIRSDDPAAILSGPKRGRGLPKVLSISDVDRLLARAKALTRRRKPLRRSGFARCGYIACWKCSTPPACGCRNWWRCRARRRGATPA